MRFDYQSPLVHARFFRWRKYIMPTVMAGLVMFAAGGWVNVRHNQVMTQKTLSLSQHSTPPPELLSTIEEITQARELWKDIVIKKGDSLSKIFSDVGLPPTALHNLLKATPVSKKLINIHPGQQISFLLDDDHELKGIKLVVSPTKTLHIRKTGSNYRYYYEEKQLSRRIAYSENNISGSLYSAAIAAGLDDRLTMQLANIFGWDIDFVLDIRENDKFRILYEEEYLDGQKIDNGNILAAEFINQGKIFRAVRFTSNDGKTGYYSPEGYSMQKAFLRTPVKFTRISSHFSHARNHPVLHRIRAHKGVDYAAPPGTPIKAAGDGKIIFIGRKGGYGKAIELQHGSKYSTLYAHLSKFARKLNKGSIVKQGQIIGYVGKTGLANGYHLHYEFRVNGRHHNPLTVKLPKSSPVAPKYQNKFFQSTKKMFAIMDSHAQTFIAGRYHD